ncbi:unnamed protein product, partial [Porites evermanni]
MFCSNCGRNVDNCNFCGNCGKGKLKLTSEISLECLWYCFTKVLQKELDSVKEQWNTHRIRKSRNDSVPGRPDSLFFLPDKGG